MADFKFFQIPNSDTWVVLDPKRAKRPHVQSGKQQFCPFCPENIQKEKSEVYRAGGEDHDTNWQVMVVPNKFPFTPVHEVVIHTREHKLFKDLTLDEFKLGIGAFINRYNEHSKKGQVCIFANSGHEAGESIAHAHSQIAVVPKDIEINVPKLEKDLSCYGECIFIGEFILMCPPYSQWPDEVWIVPKDRGRFFGQIEYKEVESLAYVLRRLIALYTLRNEDDFPFNFYIYPREDWYVRLIPRAKIPGGFEMATGIFINTQNPKETIEFIKDHFFDSDEKIADFKAQYRRGV